MRCSDWICLRCSTRRTSASISRCSAGVGFRSAPQAEHVGAFGSRMRILLVEDDAPIREAVLDVLVDEGFEVVAAETGEQALERCRDEPLDVLFTDVRLPGKVSGWDVAEMCREENPRLPVIYATGGYNSQ